MNVELLSELIPRRRPKLIYTLPTFQNPTGSVLALDRRQRLLDLATRFGIPIIEDDPYGALRFDGQPLPTLAALNQERGSDSVIYLSTMSKMLFPGFRIGWVAGPRPLLDRLAQIKQIVDLDNERTPPSGQSGRSCSAACLTNILRSSSAPTHCESTE